MSSEIFYILPESQHNALVSAAYQHRGFNAIESNQAAQFAARASKHGIRTHNALKALHLDHLFGSVAGGCKPNAEIKKIDTKFEAVEIWDAQRKLGQATAMEAMETAIALADKYGVGTVSVDNAFHYLWGGGYVMDAAERGYIAYTNCTAALTEVVPCKGKFPTLGTNPHSWGFPTQNAVGFPIVIDWATSVVAMGRVQQFAREGMELPPNAAVDSEGNPTTNPNEAKALLPFGAHKGYGLSLINEIVGAFIGGGLPTVRSRWQGAEDGEKRTPCFYFQVIHPEAMSARLFSHGRSQNENVQAVLQDVLGHGNEGCILPGQFEAEAAKKSDAAGGLLFTKAELEGFNEIAMEIGIQEWDLSKFEACK